MQKSFLKTGSTTEEIVVPPDELGVISLQYCIKGEDGATDSAGTVILEGTNTAEAWYPIKLNLPDQTTADNLGAPGLAWIDTSAFERFRARVSAGATVNGVGVALNYRSL